MVAIKALLAKTTDLSKRLHPDANVQWHRADLAQKIIDHNVAVLNVRNHEGAIATWRCRLGDNFAKPLPVL